MASMRVLVIWFDIKKVSSDQCQQLLMTLFFAAASSNWDSYLVSGAWNV